MARIAGVDLPKNKRGCIGLTYIYGIGNTIAKDILDQAKVDHDKKVIDWTDTVTITSAGGAIDDFSANPDLVTDVTASSIVLSAAEGIGATAHVDLGVTTTVSAVTTAGDIDLQQTSTAAVAVTSLTTTLGTIDFVQTGDGGSVTFGDVITTGVNTINLSAPLSGQIEFHNQGPGSLLNMEVEQPDWWQHGNASVYTTSVNWVEIILPANTQAASHARRRSSL